MSDPRRNIELKARATDLSATESRVATLDGARFAGTERQRDTYFVVTRCILKLREIVATVDDRVANRAELIGYERPYETGARTSRYRVVPVADGDGMRETLAETCGVRGIVAKERRIWLWRNVRIHIDRVDGLGDYIEFEAVLSDSDGPDVSRERVEYLTAFLGICPEDTIAGSYADLRGI